MVSELFGRTLTHRQAFEGTLKGYGGSLKSQTFNVNRLGTWLNETLSKVSLRGRDTDAEATALHIQTTVKFEALRRAAVRAKHQQSRDASAET